MRQIIIDTETTGLDYKKGHRIIEFAALEMINRKLTNKYLHFYFKPDIQVDIGAFNIHGINNNFLYNKPYFYEKINTIMNFIKGSELIIHNAHFDISFLNAELQKLKKNKWGKIDNHCLILDSLKIARKKHPGKKNSLDALCTRYKINNTKRIKHNALLDTQLLAEVFLLMTSSQLSLLSTSVVSKPNHSNKEDITNYKMINLLNNNTKSQDHENYLKLLDKHSNNNTLWRTIIYKK